MLLKKKDISKEFLEDYAIGFHMPVNVFKDKIMNIDTSKYFKDLDISEDGKTRPYQYQSSVVDN